MSEFGEVAPLVAVTVQVTVPEPDGMEATSAVLARDHSVLFLWQMTKSLPSSVRLACCAHAEAVSRKADASARPERRMRLRGVSLHGCVCLVVTVVLLKRCGFHGDSLRHAR